MRATSVLIAVCGALAVLASNTKRGLERDTHDDLVALTPNLFSDGTNLYEQWPQLGSVPVHRAEGSSGKRQPNNRLEARQPDLCLDPGYILVCPATDPLPCCPPIYPICCHNGWCCSTGTFCVGQSTCCLLTATACGEGCCASGTTCCGTTCCTIGYYCLSGQCQPVPPAIQTTTNPIPTTYISILATSSFPLPPAIQTTTNPGTSILATSSFPLPPAIQSTNPMTSSLATSSSPLPSATQSTPAAANPSGSDDTNTNPPNNAVVIGSAVGGAVGGLVLIGGVAAWLFFKAPATAAAASSSASAAQPHGYAGGVPASPSAGQPLMTSASASAMPTTPTSAGAGSGVGFAAQQPFGAYGLPLTPSNDYAQPPVGQYPQGAYGTAAPLGSPYGSAPWAGQAYGQPGGFPVPDSPGPGSRPSYYSVTPAPTYAGGSAYGGVVPEPMQPAQGTHGQFDYAQAPPSGPQVQTWVSRPDGR